MTRGRQPAPGHFLGADEDERAWLLAPREARRAQTGALLDRLSLPVGGRAVDFGCGPLGVLDTQHLAIPTLRPADMFGEQMVSRGAIDASRLGQLEAGLAEHLA